MYESGPFGEASRDGRSPVAVETFHALQQRQTSEADRARRVDCGAGSTCSTGTATGTPEGMFPAKDSS